MIFKDKLLIKPAHTKPRHDIVSTPGWSSPFVTLVSAVFLATVYNDRFWAKFLSFSGGFHLEHLPAQIAAFLIVVCIFNLLLSLLNFKSIFKPLLIFLFIASAVASFFMRYYSVSIDSVMLQNVYETDWREAKELLSWKLLLYVLLLGALPAWGISRVNIRFAGFFQGWVWRIGTIVLSLILVVGLGLGFYKNLAPLFREHRELRFLLTPTNYLQAGLRLVQSKLTRPVVVAPLATDAVKGHYWQGAAQRTVMVMIVGETARAMNFSMNGYPRITNPLLSKQTNLINFKEVYSCGTATAVSVPCLFSALGRQHYDEAKAKRQQGLLDVLAHAGIEVLWRDNNSGCKGVCDRVNYEDWSQPVAGDEYCNQEECYDERLLQGLSKFIEKNTHDLVIVLHQKGSHGPAYWKRYPAAMEVFKPVCRSNELEKCSTESIVAAYDNSILYTDYFLNKTIEMLRALQAEKKVNTALMYFSDHGESLGEKNLYLHGTPYMISPVEQRHVPFMLWFSDEFAAQFKIDRACLRARGQQTFSHDNVFPTVLGMLNINTAVYNPELDMVHPCKTH